MDPRARLVIEVSGGLSLSLSQQNLAHVMYTVSPSSVAQGLRVLQMEIGPLNNLFIELLSI